MCRRRQPGVMGEDEKIPGKLSLELDRAVVVPVQGP